MKKLFLFILSFALFCTVSTSCGGGNQNQSAEALKPVDTEKIMSLADSDSALTAEDYNFLLDQYEVLLGNAEILRRQGIDDYLKTMDLNEQRAVLNLARMLQIADKHKLFSDAQFKRFDALRPALQAD